MTGDAYSATYIPSLCFFGLFGRKGFIDVSLGYSTCITGVFLLGWNRAGNAHFWMCGFHDFATLPCSIFLFASYISSCYGYISRMMNDMCLSSGRTMSSVLFDFYYGDFESMYVLRVPVFLSWHQTASLFRHIWPSGLNTNTQSFWILSLLSCIKA